MSFAARRAPLRRLDGLRVAHDGAITVERNGSGEPTSVGVSVAAAISSALAEGKGLAAKTLENVSGRLDLVHGVYEVYGSALSDGRVDSLHDIPVVPLVETRRCVQRRARDEVFRIKTAADAVSEGFRVYSGLLEVGLAWQYEVCVVCREDIVAKGALDDGLVSLGYRLVKERLPSGRAGLGRVHDIAPGDADEPDERVVVRWGKRFGAQVEKFGAAAVHLSAVSRARPEMLCRRSARHRCERALRFHGARRLPKLSAVEHVDVVAILG